MQLQSESGPFSLPDERDLAERTTRAELRRMIRWACVALVVGLWAAVRWMAP